MIIAAVVFEVGETLIDETRHWGEWADWLGIPRLTLSAVQGAATERGEHHRAGPRGCIGAANPEARRASAIIESLDELPAVLAVL